MQPCGASTTISLTEPHATYYEPLSLDVAAAVFTKLDGPSEEMQSAVVPL